MNSRSRLYSELRTTAAFMAATLAVFICAHQQHFVLTLSDPKTFRTAATHRCGLVLLATLTWLVAEALHLTFRSLALRPQDMY